jgi:hypothetical protein
MKSLTWGIWILLTLLLAGFYVWKITLAEDKSELLIGKASHGHFQIELACNACHTEAFGGTEGLQEACEGCHAEELEEAQDAHPKKKFTDPRNADRIDILDARYCVSCHTEHNLERTHDMGVTLPEDYCFHCHQSIAEDRVSHQNLEFNSCGSAGCHNYHDNRALYERFLVDNAGGEWVHAHAVLPEASSASLMVNFTPEPVAELQQRYAGHAQVADDIHLQAGVACASCHGADTATALTWERGPGVDVCQQCHVKEAEGFMQGRHGMRLAQQLDPMTPKQGRLAFKPDTIDLTQGCHSCHQAHDYDNRKAAVESCLKCHDDRHSQNFMASPHGHLYQNSENGTTPKQASVTCATCHLPRIEDRVNGHSVVRVEHNQNHFLRPNEKMIRPVCMQCHNLQFALDALADQVLIDSNFTGQPSQHVPSIDWALKREE